MPNDGNYDGNVVRFNDGIVVRFQECDGHRRGPDRPNTALMLALSANCGRPCAAAGWRGSRCAGDRRASILRPRLAAIETDFFDHGAHLSNAASIP